MVWRTVLVGNTETLKTPFDDRVIYSLSRIWNKRRLEGISEYLIWRFQWSDDPVVVVENYWHIGESWLFWFSVLTDVFECCSNNMNGGLILCREIDWIATVGLFLSGVDNCWGNPVGNVQLFVWLFEFHQWKQFLCVYRRMSSWFSEEYLLLNMDFEVKYWILSESTNEAISCQKGWCGRDFINFGWGLPTLEECWYLGVLYWGAI